MINYSTYPDVSERVGDHTLPDTCVNYYYKINIIGFSIDKFRYIYNQIEKINIDLIFSYKWRVVISLFIINKQVNE